MNLFRTAVIFAISAFLIVSCATEQFQVDVEPSGTRIVKGIIERNDLERDSTFTWYKTNYEMYFVDTTVLNEIKTLSDGIHFVLVMGTWCGDSKREVPYLFKIFDKAKISDHRLLMVGVDRSKKSADGLTEKYNIQRVPTLIVLKGDQELGRIVETPRETLEKDIIRILQKQ
jgi:thiol-disulfide isomerase/thioredoxin